MKGRSENDESKQITDSSSKPKQTNKVVMDFETYYNLMQQTKDVDAQPNSQTEQDVNTRSDESVYTAKNTMRHKKDQMISTEKQKIQKVQMKQVHSKQHKTYKNACHFSRNWTAGGSELALEAIWPCMDTHSLSQ